jgi:glycine dehydrogenase subunit 1
MSFVPHSDADRAEMLRSVGISDVSQLYADIPSHLLVEGELDVPAALSEWEAVRLLQDISEENRALTSFAGAGIYDHHVPAAVDHLIRRSEFYTAYTPYQPEVAQGTLQAIYEFQTAVCELTGMEVANASMYDGASSAAEAALMAMAIKRRSGLVLAGSLHPHYRQVVESYVAGKEGDLRVVPPARDGRLTREAVEAQLDDDVAAILVQSPNFLGLIEDLEPLIEAAHAVGALAIVAVADALSLAVLRPPGDFGADIVVAEGQTFGIAPSFGGPLLGLFASRDKYVRRMPGRIVGATKDEEGRRGYVLTLQTREQQIRRGKATSNICTNQGLFALAATIHLALLGREGLREVAEASVRNAHYALRTLTERGVEALYPDAPFFREFAVRLPSGSREAIRRGVERGVLPGVSLERFPDLDVEDGLLIAFTEKHTKEEIDALVDLLCE